jgi:hypothetical protein
MAPVTTRGAINKVTQRMVVDHFARNVRLPSSRVASAYFFRGPEGGESLAFDGISSGDEFSLEPVKTISDAVIFEDFFDQANFIEPFISSSHLFHRAIYFIEPFG